MKHSLLAGFSDDFREGGYVRKTMPENAPPATLSATVVSNTASIRKAAIYAVGILFLECIF
jgi:hypothetical protein